jgi:hypothetical protein
MVVMTQLEILENAALNGQHTRFDNLVNFNHALFSDTLTGYVEFWSATENDVATPP